MTVYVDDMCDRPMGRLGRMKMSHMMADTLPELLAMADAIGLPRKWLQHAEKGRGFVHFDVCKAKRALAIQAGAKSITLREMSTMAYRWRVEERS